MAVDAAARASRLKIVISDDRIQAWVKLVDAGDPELQPPTAAEVLAALDAAKVKIDDAVRARVDEYIRIIGDPEAGGADQPREIPSQFLIAEGHLPTDGQDGAFEWYEQYRQKQRDWRSDDRVDYHNLSSILTIEAGVGIGRITEATKGNDGVDVCGRVLPSRRDGTPLEIGSGLTLSPDDPLEVVTAAAGHVVLRRGRVWLEEMLSIAGDVDFESGNLDVCTDVHVRGTVPSNFIVRTTKSLTVDRAIEAAQIDVGGDLVVGGGILGHGRKGKVRAGGSITARFCQEADANAGGDVKVCREIIHSHVHSEGRVLIEAGPIISGSVYAREGIEAQTLGSEAGVPTHVAVGAHRNVLAQALRLEQELNERVKLSERARTQAEPLLVNLKRLTAQQREQVAELLKKVKELTHGLDDLRRERDELLKRARSQGHPAVVISKQAFSGVCVGIGSREAVLTKPLAGPVRIEERKVKDAMEFVAINPLTNSVTVLPSTPIDLAAIIQQWEQAEQEGETDNMDADDAVA
jgi:uncharacterized protein (DUF342 family)